MTSPAATPVSSPASLIERAGLDRTRLAGILAHGLDGADDGELYLEYRQSEVLGFDNGRLKQATYDTSQGLAYAPSRTRRSAMRMPPMYPRRRSAAPRIRCAPSRADMPATLRGRPARSNARLYPDDNPLASLPFEAKVKLLQDIDAYARAKDERVRQVTASVAATWQVIEILRPDGEIYRDVRPLVRLNVSIVSATATARKPAATAMADARAMSASSPRDVARRRGRRGAPGAGQSRVGAGAGRRDGRGARPRLARRDAARGGRPRARRRFQPQEDLRLRRPDGPAGRGARRHRGGRRHHGARGAVRCRSTTRARRPTAPC